MVPLGYRSKSHLIDKWLFLMFRLNKSDNQSDLDTPIPKTAILSVKQ